MNFEHRLTTLLIWGGMQFIAVAQTERISNLGAANATTDSSENASNSGAELRERVKLDIAVLKAFSAQLERDITFLNGGIDPNSPANPDYKYRQPITRVVEILNERIKRLRGLSESSNDAVIVKAARKNISLAERALKRLEDVPSEKRALESVKPKRRD